MRYIKPRYIPVSGYLHFYRSLLLYTSIRPHVACQLLYNIYTGNLDTCQGERVRLFSSELDYSSFCRLLLCTQARPYHTPVQLYRAMEDVFQNVRGRFISHDVQESLDQLRKLSESLALRFEQIYDMDIADPRTCYSKCRSRLTSYLDEPQFSIAIKS